jgi:hypothetical protein
MYMLKIVSETTKEIWYITSASSEIMHLLLSTVEGRHMVTIH